LNFATIGYLAFLIPVVVLYWTLPRSAGRLWLIVASVVFYGTWNVSYIPGFLALLLANWGLGLAATHYRRPAVVAAVCLNLGVLAFFKYANWVLGSASGVLNQVTGTLGAGAPVAIELPLAVSFVTFTMLAYVIDISRGARPERNLGRFALFVTYFPHLIAGPIMRGHEFLPQVRHPRPFRARFVGLAVPLLVSGLVKKTVADNLAPTADAVFAKPGQFSTWSVWIGILAFAFQIFFDFSGYTDLALGSAQLLGFRLPRNFDWPYRSTSIQEFWRRWHMTLSRWLRDYLYISLGGSRRGPARTYLALTITMLLGGLWHGAGVTFIVWGAWHGLGLVVNRLVRTRFAGWEVPVVAAWASSFAFVLVGWVFFRADSLGTALAVFGQAFLPHAGETVSWPIAIACVSLTAGQWPGWTRAYRWAAPPGSMRRYLAYGIAIVLCVMLLPVASVKFIYFQF
jgi:alginate O-acetyltransferase complex protein AlgI